MKAVRSVEVKSVVIYGALLAAFWTLIYGLYTWIMGWIFGAQSWWVDMNLGNWTFYTLTTLGLVVLRAFFSALGGALAGWVIALVYNLVAGMMGGIKINLD